MKQGGPQVYIFLCNKDIQFSLRRVRPQPPPKSKLLHSIKP